MCRLANSNNTSRKVWLQCVENLLVYLLYFHFSSDNMWNIPWLQLRNCLFLLHYSPSGLQWNFGADMTDSTSEHQIMIACCVLRKTQIWSFPQEGPLYTHKQTKLEYMQLPGKEKRINPEKLRTGWLKVNPKPQQKRKLVKMNKIKRCCSGNKPEVDTKLYSPELSRTEP